jgi:flagellin-like protein
MERMKGISPLIAVIMLIAFTMIIAGILATWTTNFAQRQRVQIEFCSEAGAYIQGGTYDPAGGGTLNLIIFNNGKVPLSFIGILTYRNGTVVRYPANLDNVSEGNIKTFTMTGVSSNLEQATIQSKECQGVQDLLYYYNIRGLG